MALKDAYNLFDEGSQETLDWFSQEIAGLRTGRVAPDMVTSVQVEHYGARSPLNALAGVSSSDARTLVVSPWDPSSTHSIEKALTEADLGVTPVVDGEIIRLSFPSLTEEVREQTIKTLHKKAEEARVRLRQARDGALKVIKDEKEAGDLTEDDFYDGRSELDKKIATANATIDETVKTKEQEVRAV